MANKPLHLATLCQCTIMKILFWILQLMISSYIDLKSVWTVSIAHIYTRPCLCSDQRRTPYHRKCFRSKHHNDLSWLQLRPRTLSKNSREKCHLANGHVLLSRCPNERAARWVLQRWTLHCNANANSNSNSADSLSQLLTRKLQRSLLPLITSKLIANNNSHCSIDTVWTMP